MGLYLNPGCDGFQMIRNGIYVDKTGLIEYINSTINTPRKLTCFSRPRRFGKSFAAKMLCAYYDRSCDTQELFAGLSIAEKASYKTYLNYFDVIYLDITWFVSVSADIDHVVKDIQSCVIQELRSVFSDLIPDEEASLPKALACVSQETGRKFVMIIDEWDALFREAKDHEQLQKEYVQLLRGLFKGGVSTDRTIAAAYMTGILPIKKYGTESALTDFKEFTMENPARLSEYVGFTEPEVSDLCKKFQLQLADIHEWYDGYSFSRTRHVYSPNSVMNAVENGEIQNYWKNSETFESLKQYIEMNFDGLKDAIVLMLGGQRVKIDTGTFQNDLVSFRDKNDVLTLLIHLGYLAYDQNKKEVYIPNREVAEVFQSVTKGEKWQPVEQAITRAENLLEATIRGESDVVADSLELMHEECSSILAYNDENALACAIYIAYYTARNYYTIVREMPAGKGFADYVFLPHKDTDKPAMIVELKYDKNADTAIRQIHENRYDGALKSYAGHLLLVGINYDKKRKGIGQKQHSCIIERI